MHLADKVHLADNGYGTRLSQMRSMVGLAGYAPFSVRCLRRSPGREEPDAYAISAEFYDVLQGERDAARVRRFYGRDVGSARVGVLDVGAGTGRVTVMSLMESQVPVHAVEPAHSMRCPLMTRLAALPAELRMRVTVHPHAR